MDGRREPEAAATGKRTTVERRSDCEVVVTRTFEAPPHLVFEAWTRPELFRRWWVPKSFGLALLSCEMDVRVGGKYRLAFANDPSPPMEFFGEYIEVTPHARLAWTNDEGGEGGAVTTVTFEADGDRTLVVIRDRYPSKEALDASGAMDGMPESLDQLDELLVTLGARVGRSS